MRAWLPRVFCLLFWCWAGLAGAVQPVPPLTGRVVDLTASLDAAVAAGLEQRLAALEQAGAGQLAVLVVVSTQPETIEQYSLRVVEAWKLGKKGKDDGVLLILAKADRALRIEVGYGLEGAIPDVAAKRVIAEIMVPRLGQGDFNGAVTAGVEALAGLMRGEALSSPPSAKPEQEEPLWLRSLGDLAPAALALVMLAGHLLRALFGRLPAAGLAGGVVFLGVMLLAGAWVLALIAGGIAFVVVLMGGAGRVGRGGGGFGGGGFGGGGFGGGGGGFGGGGASGRW